MKPEKRLLVNDLLGCRDAEAHRTATLVAGRRVLRNKRWRRAAARGLGLAILAGAAVVPVLVRNPPHPRIVTVTPSPVPPVHEITDDQLLALFPNTPVGLATVGNRKVLVFPRAGDRERFVGKF